MERRRAPLLRQFFFAILRLLLYVRDCDISFITSWAIPRIRNIASSHDGKETISSLHNSVHNRSQRPNERSLSMRAFFRGYMEVSTVLLLPHCCYWKGDTASAEVLQHAQCRGERGIGIYGMLGESPGGSIPFFFLFRKANLLSERRTDLHRVLMRPIYIYSSPTSLDASCPPPPHRWK